MHATQNNNNRIKSKNKEEKQLLSFFLIKGFKTTRVSSSVIENNLKKIIKN